MILPRLKTVTERIKIAIEQHGTVAPYGNVYGRLWWPSQRCNPGARSHQPAVNGPFIYGMICIDLPIKNVDFT